MFPLPLFTFLGAKCKKLPIIIAIPQTTNYTLLGWTPADFQRLKLIYFQD